MLTHEDIRNDVDIITNEILSSRRPVVSLLICIKPIVKLTLFALVLDLIGVFFDLAMANKLVPFGVKLFSPLAILCVGVVCIAISFRAFSVYYMISPETRNELPLLVLLKKKLDMYKRFNVISWVVITVVGCIYGIASGILPMFISISVFLTFVFLWFDATRYQVSGMLSIFNTVASSISKVK